MKSKIIHGNCLKVMKDMPDNCVDTIITDPPYGLKFMGKSWDHGVPGPRYWKQCLRVCKPGAILMAFGGTRTYHRLTCAIEDAGWEIRDCIQWIYGSGFPKSLDISKAIDKAAGAEREDLGPHPTINGKGDHFAFCSNYDGARITAPATPLGKIWDGWGTALKPSWEPVIVAMKPLDGTFANNAEKWGVAGLHIEGGRIDTEDNLSGGAYNNGKQPPRKMFHGLGKQPEDLFDTPEKGRFPANTILDEEAAAMLDKQSGVSGGGKLVKRKRERNKGWCNASPGPGVDAIDNFADSGGASRFFYTAKASKSERNAGCGELETEHWSDGRNKEQECPHQRYDVNRKNSHPTVKPLALMEYLCRLTRTPTGGIVLDPFAGSGTTALACLNTHRKYIMIEKKKKYYNIMKARIKGRKKNKRLLDA